MYSPNWTENSCVYTEKEERNHFTMKNQVNTKEDSNGENEEQKARRQVANDRSEALLISN